MTTRIFNGLLMLALLSLALGSGCGTATRGSSPGGDAAVGRAKPDGGDRKNAGDGSATSEGSAGGNAANNEKSGGGNVGDADVNTAAANDQATGSSTAGDDEVLAVDPRSPTVPVDNGKPVEITWDDLLIKVQQSDIVIRPWMYTDRIQELDGRRVRIKGYMREDSKLAGIKQFILLRNSECKFGPGGQADHLVMVMMKDGETTSLYSRVEISVEGILRINPYQGGDGNTWSLFDLEKAENVTRVR